MEVSSCRGVLLRRSVLPISVVVIGMRVPVVTAPVTASMAAPVRPVMRPGDVGLS
jgi:hypothetical protein